MSEPFDESDLSNAGMRRREEILRLALQAGRRRQRRWQARVIGSCAALALLVFLIISTPLRRERSIVHRFPAPIPSPVGPGRPIAPENPKTVVVRIRSDPGLLDRLAIRPDKAAWKAIGDDELLHELAEAGRPAGLEYGSRGEVVVLYR